MVAMGHSFNCIPTTTAATPCDFHSGSSHEDEDDHQRHERSQNVHPEAPRLHDCHSAQRHWQNPRQHRRCPIACCTCLEMPPEAKAFEFLSTDIGLRSSAKSLLNPAMQFY